MNRVLLFTFIGMFVITLEAKMAASSTRRACKPSSSRFANWKAACSPIEWKPNCITDTEFAAVQCKGEQDDGRCFCYSADGTKLGGWAWWSQDSKMNCRCSRQRHRLKTQLERDDVSLHCTRDGNYEELQCDYGMCWCVVPETGKPTERIYPKSMMKYLPCYPVKVSKEEEENDEMLQETQAPQSYLRKCESKALARFEVMEKLRVHGRTNVHIAEPLCDIDGSYASYQLSKNSVFCAWKDGKIIGSFTSPTSVLSDLDCNCARDGPIYAEEDLQLELGCDNHGNYESLQSSNGRPFCVDSDGFAMTELCNLGQTLSCPRVIQ